MPSLDDLKKRIASTKSTRKITSAMKMVAASKLKKVQEKAAASQPYARAMSEMLSRVAANVETGPGGPRMLTGTGKTDTHLVVVISSDRGLCAGFNANVIRKARDFMTELEQDGQDVKLICIGRKVSEQLGKAYPEKTLRSFTNLGGKHGLNFEDTAEISDFITENFDRDAFDICTLVYNEFVSVLAQRPKPQQLIPFKIADDVPANDDVQKAETAPYTYEPSEEKILSDLLPRNLATQVYQALIESAAGEQAARMTAMDNATRNAGDMINDLTLQYNRARQAFITKELIEIISGAEAV